MSLARDGNYWRVPIAAQPARFVRANDFVKRGVIPEARMRRAALPHLRGACECREKLACPHLCGALLHGCEKLRMPGKPFLERHA
jgi:hypothetical protein